jgi:hypothetical protein
VWREQLKKLLKATPGDLRKFGLMVGGVLLGGGLVLGLQHKSWWACFVALGALLVIAGAILPGALKWIYVGWMMLAMITGTVVSTALLTILFCAVVTPVGWIARLAGKDFLRQRIEPNAPSYWIVRDPSKSRQKLQHERQF